MCRHGKGWHGCSLSSWTGRTRASSSSANPSPRMIRTNSPSRSRRCSSRIIELKGTEVQFFNKADFVQVSLGVATPGVSTVNFRTTDNVHVRVWSEFSYKVNP